MILSATRGALIAIAMVSLWPLGRGRVPVVRVLLSLCAAVMVLSELYLQQGPWVARSLWSIVPASILESLSIALLLGLGIGLLCGDLARTLSAFMRGDPAVTIFWAIVGVLGVMTFVPTERMIHIIVPWVIYGRNAFKVWGVGDPREYNFLVLRLSSANRVVVLIIAKAVFIGLGAAAGGLLGALSSRESKP